MPKILIWRPKIENQAGHVSMTTDKYYISFWPASCLQEDGKKMAEHSDRMGFVFGTKGCLVINQNVDRENEENCDPDIEYVIDSAVGNEDINSVYEGFLLYNGINPEEVTLAKGDEEYQEYTKRVAGEEAKRKENRQLPHQLLAKTEYSIVAGLVSSKKDDDSAPFYNSHQSCVSFAFNLVQMAWLMSHQDPIPIVNPEGLKRAGKFPYASFASAVTNLIIINKTPKTLAYKVPWFEREVVQRYLIAEETDDRALLTYQYLMDYWKRGVRGLKKDGVIVFFEIWLVYFFPVMLYPSVLIYFYFSEDGESYLKRFILPLFIILLDHIFSWGVILPILIFQVYEIFIYIPIQMNRSGELLLLFVEVFVVVKRFFEEFKEYRKSVGYPDNDQVGSWSLFKLLINFRRAR